MQTWTIAPGDPTCVIVPGVAKPIACGSKERALMVAATPDLFEALRDLKALVLDGYQHNDMAMTRSLTQAQAAIDKATTVR